MQSPLNTICYISFNIPGFKFLIKADKHVSPCCVLFLAHFEKLLHPEFRGRRMRDQHQTSTLRGNTEGGGGGDRLSE